MNKIFLAVLSATIMLTGCVTSKEIIIGKDAQGNDIVKTVEGIDYKKACISRTNLAVSYINNKDLTMAKVNLETAQSYDPDNEVLLLAWGYYYSTVNDDYNAEKIYKKAVDLYPESGTVYTNYGSFLCSRKKFTEGNEMFVKAVSLPNYTNYGYSYQQAAICSYESGDKVKAGEYFEKAMNYGGNSPSLLFNYASYSLENGDAIKADKLMRTFDLFEKNNTAQTYMLKIKIAQALQQYATAEIFGQKLLRDFPKSNEATMYKKGEY
ncbi:MAG: type IV pilus biogenesis/stability protein PilW [Succinivibrionaceae bacterium]